MPIPQFGHDRDWVETSVLSQSRRDDLERLCERLETVRLLAL